jgi:hypothetical protein
MLQNILTKLFFCKRSPLTGLLFASLLTLTLTGTLTGATYERIGLLTGVTVNNYQPLGRMQIVLKLSDKVHFCPGMDFSRTEEAYTGRFLFSPWKWDKVRVHFVLGPQIEAVNEDPTQEEQIYYLMSATGVIFTWEYRTGLHFAFGVDYLSPNKEVAPWKVGAGIIAWF